MARTGRRPADTWVGEPGARFDPRRHNAFTRLLDDEQRAVVNVVGDRVNRLRAEARDAELERQFLVLAFWDAGFGQAELSAEARTVQTNISRWARLRRADPGLWDRRRREFEARRLDDGTLDIWLQTLDSIPAPIDKTPDRR